MDQSLLMRWNIASEKNDTRGSSKKLPFFLLTIFGLFSLSSIAQQRITGTVVAGDSKN
jgi:hypothetical protein